MQNYNLYEEISSSDKITIFKGRRKQSIKFVDIKRIDKSIRGQILNEVGVLYILNHPNVQKFISWYETPKHLWVIVEHCSGGNLGEMLQDAGKFSETTAIRFLAQVTSALFYVHSRGLVNPCLDPKSLLLDESGMIRLSRFPFADSIAAQAQHPERALSQPKSLEECIVRAKERALPVPAPEWFALDSTPLTSSSARRCPSFASDLWALGCLAYTFVTGLVPFVDQISNPDRPELNVDAIVTPFAEEANSRVFSTTAATWSPLGRQDSTRLSGWPANPTSFGVSEIMAHFIRRLLTKDPSQRMDWQELLAHPIWNLYQVKLNLDSTQVPWALLPTQPQRQTNSEQAPSQQAPSAARHAQTPVKPEPEVTTSAKQVTTEVNQAFQSRTETHVGSRVTRQRVHTSIDTDEQLTPQVHNQPQNDPILEPETKSQRRLSQHTDEELRALPHAQHEHPKPSEQIERRQAEVQPAAQKPNQETVYKALVRDALVEKLFLRREVALHALVDLDSWNPIYIASGGPSVEEKDENSTRTKSALSGSLWDIARQDSSEPRIRAEVRTVAQQLVAVAQSLSQRGPTSQDKKSHTLLSELILTLRTLLRPSPIWDAEYSLKGLAKTSERKEGFAPQPSADLNQEKTLFGMFAAEGGIDVVLKILDVLEGFIAHAYGNAADKSAPEAPVEFPSEFERAGSTTPSTRTGAGGSASQDSFTLSIALSSSSPRAATGLQLDRAEPTETFSSLVCLAICLTLHVGARTVRSAANVTTSSLQSLCVAASNAIVRGVSSAEYLLAGVGESSNARLLCGQLILAGVLALGETVFCSAYEALTALRKNDPELNSPTNVCNLLLPGHSYAALVRLLGLFKQFIVYDPVYLSESDRLPNNRWPLLAVDLAASVALAFRFVENVCHFLSNTTRVIGNQLVNLIALIFLRDTLLLDNIASTLSLLAPALTEGDTESRDTRMPQPSNIPRFSLATGVASLLAHQALDALSSMLILGLPTLPTATRARILQGLSRAVYPGPSTFSNAGGNEAGAQELESASTLGPWISAQLAYFKTIERSRLFKMSLEAQLTLIIVVRNNAHAIRRALLLLNWMLLVSTPAPQSEDVSLFLSHQLQLDESLIIRKVVSEGHQSDLESIVSPYITLAGGLCQLISGALSLLSGGNINEACRNGSSMKLPDSMVNQLLQVNPARFTMLRLAISSATLVTLLAWRCPSVWTVFFLRVRIRTVATSTPGAASPQTQKVALKAVRDPMQPLFILEQKSPQNASHVDAPNVLEAALATLHLLALVDHELNRLSIASGMFIAEIAQHAALVTKHWIPCGYGTALASLLRQLARTIAFAANRIEGLCVRDFNDVGACLAVPELRALRNPQEDGDVYQCLKNATELAVSAAASSTLVKAHGLARSARTSVREIQELRQAVGELDVALRGASLVNGTTHDAGDAASATEIYRKTVLSSLTEAYANALATLAASLPAEARVMLEEDR